MSTTENKPINKVADKLADNKSNGKLTDKLVPTTNSTENKPTDKPTDEPVKSTKKRCLMCKTKVGLNYFECACNNIFCTKHRLPFDHSCTFDHAKKNKDKLEKNNPKIQKEKLTKI